MFQRVLVMALISLAGSAFAEDAMKTVPADTPIKWMDSMALGKGAQGAILIGDPTKTGEIVVLLTKFPANYESMPHTHPFTETITVMSGEIGLGMGEKFDKTGPMYKVGTVQLNPAKHAHFVWTGNEPAIIQVQYVGPGGLDYVNPADDPRKK